MSKSKSKPEISYENGRWSVGSYSTSVPNKAVNYLRKRGTDISLEDVMALATAEPPVATAEPPAPPEESADNNDKEN